MKFTLLLFLLPTILAAQQATIHERETDDRYTFRVHLTKGRSSQLMRCANEATGNNINVHMKGDLTSNIAADATLRVNTHARTLWIEHRAADAAVRKKVKQTATEVRDCLGMPPPPGGRAKLRNARPTGSPARA